MVMRHLSVGGEWSVYPKSDPALLQATCAIGNISCRRLYDGAMISWKASSALEQDDSFILGYLRPHLRGFPSFHVDVRNFYTSSAYASEVLCRHFLLFNQFGGCLSEVL